MLVTGAIGNVGIVVLFLLRNIGINIEVITSKEKNKIIFKEDGCNKIIQY